MLTLLVLLACKKDDAPVGGDDTAVGGPDDSPVDDSGEVECSAKPASILPEDEAEDVYWRDTITVTFTLPVDDATFTLRRTDTGSTTPVEEEWSEDRSFVVLTPTPNLDPSAPYALDIEVCGATYTSTLSTSAWGTPLAEDASSLLNRTYAIELSKVQFTQPEGIGGILALYLDTPLLIGVTEVKEDSLTLLGAQGRVTSDGLYAQRKKVDGEDIPTFDFNDVDFASAPYFTGDTSLVEIIVSGVHIQLYDFHIEGTFASDLSSFGGGEVWGLGDTREMGALFDKPEEPNAICDMIAEFGGCQACPDGETYCVFLKGEQIEAPQVPDLILERIPGT